MTRRLEFGKATSTTSPTCAITAARVCTRANTRRARVRRQCAAGDGAGARSDYADYAWPAALGALYRRNGLTLSLAVAGALALFLVLAVARNGSLWNLNSRRLLPRFSARFDGGLFTPVFAFAVLALSVVCIDSARMRRPVQSRLQRQQKPPPTCCD